METLAAGRGLAPAGCPRLRRSHRRHRGRPLAAPHLSRRGDGAAL